jgi:cell wall-associated NlpC family hydrolase
MAAKTHYVVIKTTADLLDHTENGPRIGQRDSQLLFGETFTAQRTEGEWIYGTSDVDGYVGYINQRHLAPLTVAATHIVSSTGTHVYPDPDFKTRPIMALGFMSRVSVNGSAPQNGFLEIQDMGWVPHNHLEPISKLGHESDIAKTALKFLNVPYLYGGRTGLGIDCSGLTQLSLLYAGVQSPRDSDQQIGLGTDVKPADIKRGDLVFFKGHVGIMVDETSAINATARTMDTRVEPLSTLIDHYKGLLGARRIAL